MSGIPQFITITRSEDNNGDDDNNNNNPLLNNIFHDFSYYAIALACRTALYATDYIISDKFPSELLSIFTDYNLFYNRYRVLLVIKQIQIPNIQIIPTFGSNTENTTNVSVQPTVEELTVDSAQRQDELARKIDRLINNAKEHELELLDKINNAVDNNEMNEIYRVSLGKVRKNRATLEDERRKLDSIRNNKKEVGDNNDKPTAAISLADKQRRRAKLLARHSNRRKKTTAASSSAKTRNSNNNESAQSTRVPLSSTTTESAEERQQQLERKENEKEQRESSTILSQDNDQFTTTLETEAGDDRVVINAEITSKELDLQQAVITSPTGAATDFEVMAFQSSGVPSIPTLGGEEQGGVSKVSAAQEVTSVVANVSSQRE